MIALARQLQRLDRGHRWQQCIECVAPRLFASSLIAGVGVLFVRLAWPAGESLVAAVAAAGVLAPLPWLPRAWGRGRPRAQLAAELDLLAGANGTLMAVAESPASAWDEIAARQAASMVLPALRWRPLAPALLSVLMLLGALALPQTTVVAPVVSPAAALVAPVRAEVGTLADIGVLTPDERHELERRLAELVAQTQGPMLDQATWQGLDSVQARLDQQAVAAGERLAAALAAAQALASAAPPAPGDAAATQQAAQLADALAASMAELAVQAPGLLPALGDPQMQAALAKALAQAQMKGLLSPAQRAALERAGMTAAKSGDGAPSAAECRALARTLAQELERRRQGLGNGRAGSSAQTLLALLQQNQRCKGWGVGRGPGEAPIEHESRARTDGGEQQGLAPGVTMNPDGSVTIAAQARDAEPDAAARAELQRSAAQAFDPAAADSRRATIAPRHRAAVEAYFHSDDH